MKGNLLCALPALFLLAGGALAAPGDRPAPRPGGNSEVLSTLKDSTAGVIGVFTAEITRSTQGFVNAVAINDMYEVGAGRIALQRAQSPAVRAFARQMMDAHAGTTAMLKKVVRNNNVNVTFPDRMDLRRRGLLDDLRGAAAGTFDHRYLVQQIAAHKEVDILIHRYAVAGKINAMKNFAINTDRTVETHLSMAKDLDTRIRNRR